MTFSCDIETDGLDPTVVWCIVCQNVDTKERFVFDYPLYKHTDVANSDLYIHFNDWVQQYSVETLVFHNGISFDVPVLEKLLGTNFSLKNIEDTLIMSQLNEPRMEGGHSLRNWGDKFNFPKGDYTDWSEYTTEMLEYCIRDVDITTQLYLTLKNKLHNQKEALELEYKTKEHCSEQEKNGWRFDIRESTKVLRDITEELRKAEEEVHRVFKPLPVWKGATRLRNKFKKNGTRTLAYAKQVALQCHTNDDGEYGYYDYPQLNLGSRQQVAHHLTHYGWKPTKFTDTGRPKVDEKILEGVDIPEARIIARYLMLQKRQSQLNSWIDNYNHNTKAIHSRVHTIGTVTNRMSSSGPNLQQVTASDKEFGSAMRSLFITSSDSVLVGADLSGLELRCLAHYMNDADYTDEILTGDIHTKNQESAGLSTRNEAKRFIYAYLYGGGDELIGKIVGGDKADGREIKNKFLDNTPALRELRTRVEKKALRGYLKGLDNRIISVRSPHSALNFLLQSAGAIIAKRAWVIFHQNCILPYKQLGVIHDEIQIECLPEHAEQIGREVVKAMQDTTKFYKLRCPIDGEYKIGRSWNDTH
jgi:DNA polymerase I-like protein with 3'-5' exonuclease and polymerase domains